MPRVKKYDHSGRPKLSPIEKRVPKCWTITPKVCELISNASKKFGKSEAFIVDMILLKVLSKEDSI